MARTSGRLDHIERDVAQISDGVKTLIDRDARRPEPMSWTMLAGGAGGLAAIALVGWWLIGQSPAVQELQDRMTDLDHEKRGRLTLVEQKVDKIGDRLEQIEAWSPKVTRN